MKAFEDKYRVNESGCWLWTASTTRDGYGKIGHIGKTIAAHRAAWMLYKGKIPKGKCVLHRCDVRLCVNPEHLFLGTKKANTRDMLFKGRHGRKKLTKEMIAEIRAKDLSKYGSFKAEADRLGILPGFLWKIRNNQAWRFV